MQQTRDMPKSRVKAIDVVMVICTAYMVLYGLGLLIRPESLFSVYVRRDLRFQVDTLAWIQLALGILLPVNYFFLRDLKIQGRDLGSVKIIGGHMVFSLLMACIVFLQVARLHETAIIHAVNALFVVGFLVGMVAVANALEQSQREIDLTQRTAKQLLDEKVAEIARLKALQETKTAGVADGNQRTP